MTTLTNIYNAVDTALDSVWGSTHTELVNPFVVELNESLALNRGYGFYFGPGANTRRQLSCQLSIEREIVVINTMINRGTERDVAIRKTAEKQLLEDQFALIDYLETEPTIHGLVSKLEFNSDNGIEFVFDEKFNYIYIESSFSMEYFEDLS